jgi:hypothetical protein
MKTTKEFLRSFKDRIGLRSQSSPLGSEATEIEETANKVYTKYPIKVCI